MLIQSLSYSIPYLFKCIINIFCFQNLTFYDANDTSKQYEIENDYSNWGSTIMYGTQTDILYRILILISLLFHNFIQFYNKYRACKDRTELINNDDSFKDYSIKLKFIPRNMTAEELKNKLQRSGLKVNCICFTQNLRDSSKYIQKLKDDFRNSRSRSNYHKGNNNGENKFDFGDIPNMSSQSFK